MTQRDWATADAHVLGVFLNGDELARAPAATASPSHDDSFLLLFNAHHEDVTFQLPSRAFGRRWTLELSTASPEAETGSRTYAAREAVVVGARSVLLLRRDDVAVRD